MSKLIGFLTACLNFALIFQAYAQSPNFCYPKPCPQCVHYIIAYGSLMENQSKANTDSSSGENIPVLIDHYQRGWFAKGKSIGLSTTYLAVRKNQKSSFNAAVFRLANVDSIKNYDKREKYYCRSALSREFIHPLNGQPLPKAKFWIYELKPEFYAQASEKYPLVESYIDIFLTGCLEIQEKFHLKQFAANCIDTTTAWSAHWVNDRIYPRRPFVFQPYAVKIDQLLAERIPQYFRQIKLEATQTN
jgi:hypothetical protein